MTLDNFKAKYSTVDLSGGIGDVTGQLLRCFCKVIAFPAEFTFSPAPASRSRARTRGTHSGGTSAASRGREIDTNNPWARIHAVDANGNISNPVVLLALCIGVDAGASILRAYKSRERTDITGRSQTSTNTFNRL